MNSETDFVARNKDFQEFVSSLSTATLKIPNTTAGIVQLDIPTLEKATLDGQRTIGDALGDLVAKIREKITIRRAAKISGEGKLMR